MNTMSVPDEEMQPAATVDNNNVATENPSSKSFCSKWKILALISCGSCTLIAGLICLVLYLTGFFTFEEPTLLVDSFAVGGLELEQGDLLIPTLATLQLQLFLQVNNTNAFKISYKALEPGTIHVPEFLLNGATSDGDVEVSNGDFFIGNWKLPDGTLDKKSSSQAIPVDVIASIDLAKPETRGLAPIFLQGGRMAFLINGEIKASTWIPFLKGRVGFLCLVIKDNILAFGDDARIRCRTSVSF